MRVKCIHNIIDDELAKRVGLANGQPVDYSDITIGKEYIVLGLCYYPASPYYAGKPTLEIKDDTGELTTIPLFMFEIIDSTPSKYWQIRFNDKGFLTMYPESFYKDFYHDDLSEDVPEIKADFAQVCEKLEKEQVESKNLYP